MAAAARRALIGMRSSPPAVLSRAFSRPAAAQPPEASAGAAFGRSYRRRHPISRVAVEALGGAQCSLMPLHSATASALLTSMLGLKPGSWGWLSEGFATPL